jgi:hypothetical protein
MALPLHFAGGRCVLQRCGWFRPVLDCSSMINHLLGIHPGVYTGRGAVEMHASCRFSVVQVVSL